ncbi:MAG: EVE domain-containing protein [Sulfolobus sp.]
MTYWLIPVREDFWEVVMSTNVYGYEKESIMNTIKKDDILLFYVGKYYAKKYGGKFVGLMRVISDWYKDESILFPDEKIYNKPKYIYRVKLEPIIIGECAVKDVLYELSFIEDKFQFSKYLRNVPANLKRPLPEKDVKLIEECIRQSIP